MSEMNNWNNVRGARIPVTAEGELALLQYVETAKDITADKSDTVNLTDWVKMVECSEEITLKVTTVSDSVITKLFYKGYNWIPIKQLWDTDLGTAQVIGWY